MITHDDLRRTVHRCVPRLLRTPLIRRRVRNCGMNDCAATQIEEEEDEDLSKPNVERLHEIAGLAHMIPQERGPVLSVTSEASTAHVPLYRPLTHPDAQLEQLAANPLGTPEWISRCHFTDQGGTRCRRSTKAPRSSSPQGAESRSVPAQHGRRLDEQSCPRARLARGARRGRWSAAATVSSGHGPRSCALRR
jgi:hypothetical protein